MARFAHRVFRSVFDSCRSPSGSWATLCVLAVISLPRIAQASPSTTLRDGLQTLQALEQLVGQRVEQWQVRRSEVLAAGSA
ncbi:MAG TPA: hypothetical protein DCQ06_09680, partial [Myxococcales bacterium]|nr:hypothetical protein [Myxococcales bacterium]